VSSGSKTIEGDFTPKFRNFDWEKAKSFYYVAKCGSFASAARFLNTSQPALSRQVLYLEAHLGSPLFSRHSGGVALTRKGKELFAIVETTFMGLKEFTQSTHATLSKGKKRKIRIAATHADTAYILNEYILEYNIKYPEYIFEIIANDQLIDITLNDVDIAIRPYDPTARGVQQELLFTLEKKLYASTRYLEKYGEPQTVEDLQHHRLIAFSHPDLHPYADVNWILRLGMPEGKLHEPVFTSNSLECLIEAAKKGLGIIASSQKMTILRKANLKNILPSIKLTEKDGYFIYPNYLKKDEEIIEIKKYLQESLR